MNNEIIKLAVILLQRYSSDLGNNGCNDTDEELRSLIKIIGVDRFNEMATEMNGDIVDAAQNYDFLVCDTVAHELKKLITK